jgi:phage major head subunit gpT-like protein
MAGNALQTRLQAADLFFSRLPFIDEIIHENFDAPSLTYTEVFDVRSSERAFEETTGFSGFGLFPEKEQDGGTVEYDSMLQEYDNRLVHATYSKGFQVTEEGQEDDIDGVISDSSPALGRSAQSSIETVAWNLFNDAFTTEQTPDGVSLFNNSHPLIGGGTQDNLIAGDLSVASLQSAITLVDKMIDGRGLPIQAVASTIVVPVDLRWIADTILQSQLLPATGNNDINPITNTGLRRVESKYLTNATDWFVGIEPSLAKLLFYWRKEPVTDHVLDFDSGNMKSKMTYRLSRGAADYKGWVGGDGA